MFVVSFTKKDTTNNIDQNGKCSRHDIAEKILASYFLLFLLITIIIL
jgi:hypothetical protein